MAKYRNVYMSFWTDTKVLDEFTPEDKFFYLYLMTNPHTSLCGCYEISLTQMSNELGYTKDSIVKLINRFTMVHDLIRYDFSTKEIIILHWYKYNWTESEKTMIGVQKGIDEVKNEMFKEYLQNVAGGNYDVRIDVITNNNSHGSMPHTYPLYETVTFICLNTLNNNIKDNNIIKDKDIDNYSNIIKEIMEYFNNITGKKYKASSKSTRSHITARLKEGFSVDDFKSVIDKKTAEWKDNPKMEQYLRPETLFGTKFESYLNQKSSIKNDKDFDIDDFIAKRGNTQ